ncbi:PQQ-binding-like beta-propeller repeat protein [Halomonas sp. THAF12]|uniref:Vgb family protein n=1 Tax=Halomonas sp. B23F22_10 TaxID=3459515 RepID=UPI00373DEFA1
MKGSTAEIIAEYGPFPDITGIHGVTYDGQRVWFASDGRLTALDPDSGEIQRTLEVAADAGTAFDGRHLFQMAGDRIQRIDPDSGRVLTTIPAPPGDCNSGLAWAEGSLWVGQYRDRRIQQVDPDTGELLRSIATDRFVTGVSWVDGELWHGTWQDDESDVRRLDPRTGEVLERLEMPAGTGVSGLESDGAGRLFCGGGDGGTLRILRRPTRALTDDAKAAADASSP